MSERDAFLRELHHRVRNNFQIIASLMNLLRRTPSANTNKRDDLRFLEEHVQAMAVAYRVVDAGRETVAIDELIREVVENLRQIAGLEADMVTLRLAEAHGTISLDQAIALGLYLAVALPPCLDQAALTGVPADIVAVLKAGWLTLSTGGEWRQPVDLDFLRNRLVDAYIHQFGASRLFGEESTALRIRFPLEAPDTGMQPALPRF